MISNHFIFFTILFSAFFFNSAWGQSSFQKTFGGVGNDVAYSIDATSDGGWVLAGYTTTFGSGDSDVYVIKLDPAFGVQWSKSYGGPGKDVANFIRQTSDGGYIIAGNTESYGAGGKDALAIKLDAAGNVQWSKTFGGFDDENFQAVVESTDGGVAFAGYTASFSAGAFDFYIVKTSGNGTLQWSKTFGQSSYEYANSIIQTADGGYMAAGSNLSFGSGLYDNYLVKMDASGNMQWNKTIGGADHDGIRTVIQLPGGEYVMIGNSYSFAIGDRDVYLVKTNSQGSVLWSKTYGGVNDDHGWTVRLTSDSGFICVGFTNTFGAGSYDIFVVKTDSLGNIQWSKTYGGNGYDDGWEVEEIPGGGYLISGYTASFGSGGNDVYLIKVDSDGDVCCNMQLAPALSTSPNSIATIPPPDISSPTASASASISSVTSNPQVQNYCAISITATVSDSIIEAGGQVQFNVYGATQFTWTSQAPLSCNDCSSPTAMVDTTSYFFLEATDSNGCMFKDTFLVKVENACENLVVVAGAFSPNGDGINEVIQPFFSSPLSGFKLMIFNRWGEMVFESANPHDAWEGSYKGVTQDIQVFAYLLQYSCMGKDYFKSGNITLVR